MSQVGGTMRRQWEVRSMRVVVIVRMDVRIVLVVLAEQQLNRISTDQIFILTMTAKDCTENSEWFCFLCHSQRTNIFDKF